MATKSGREAPATSVRRPRWNRISGSRHQIEARVQEDPDDIDEVPVQPNDVYLPCQRPATGVHNSPGEEEHETDADGEMDEMQSGRREVKAEKDQRPTGVTRIEAEVHERHEALVVIERIFGKLHARENESESGRGKEEGRGALSLAGFGACRGERHEQDRKSTRLNAS